MLPKGLGREGWEYRLWHPQTPHSEIPRCEELGAPAGVSSAGKGHMLGVALGRGSECLGRHPYPCALSQPIFIPGKVSLLPTGETEAVRGPFSQFPV